MYSKVVAGLFLCLCLLLAIPSFADQIVLKNGDKITRPIPAGARCSSSSRSGGPRSKRCCCSSNWSGRRSRTRARDELLAGDDLEFCAHHLRSARRYRPHLLSEPEEKILAEKSIASNAAWARLFGELTSALRVPLDGDEVSLELALSQLQSTDRDLRRRAPRRSPRRSSPACARAPSSSTR